MRAYALSLVALAAAAAVAPHAVVAQEAGAAGPQMLLLLEAPRLAPGEAVRFLVKNTGTEPLNGTLRIEVHGPDPAHVEVLFEGPVFLKPGAWMERPWKLPAPGEYEAKARLESPTHLATSSHTFHVTSTTPTYPPPAGEAPPPGPAPCCAGGLALVVGRPDYPPGAVVGIALSNRGTEPLGGPLFLGIANLRLEPVRKLAAGDVNLTLRPGEVQTFTWDQRDGRGGPVAPGCYLAMAMLAGQHESEPFSIGGASCTTSESQPRPMPTTANGKAVTTPKPAFAPGEPVVIRVTNVAGSDVRGDAEVEIRDSAGVTRVAFITVFGAFLSPGATLDVRWDQRDVRLRQVAPGCYVAMVRLGTLFDGIPFGVGKEACAAAPFPVGHPEESAPIAWESRGEAYWTERYPREADLRESWPEVQEHQRTEASFWLRAPPEVRADLLRDAERKNLFGGFEYQPETGAVTGPLVRFAYEEASGTLRALDVRRGAGWARLFERVALADLDPTGPPFLAGPLFLQQGKAATIEAHHSPAAPVVHRAGEGGNLVTYALPAGSRAELLGSHAVALHGPVEAMLMLMGPGNLTLTQGAIAAKLAPFASVAVMALQAPAADAPWSPEAREAIARAVASGSVAGEITLVAGNGTVADAIVPYHAVQLRTRSAELGHVVVEVSSDLREGKAVVMNLDEDLVGGGQLRVLFDGAPASEADDLGDALTVSEGEGVEFYVVAGKAGLQVVVQIPHFSPHVLEVLSLPPELVGPLVPMGIIAGVVLLAGLAGLMLRDHRFRV